ncbi:MAG TPA: TPM domain-containing protein [Thermoanaerobaculia bacterium]|nr:TPM domain-containing protein [Thermoanaerobaculia bacterium]
MRPFRVAAAFLLLAALAAPAFAKEPPAAPTQWFTDEAGLVQGSDAAALNEKLRAFEQSSGAQFIVYVFKSLDGDPLEDFTIRCAEKWKVGNKKYDNGLILFVFVQDRKFRIEVGYGLEGAVTDAFSSDVLRNYLTPHFRQGDYAGGLNAAADAIMAKIRGEEPARPPVNPDTSQGRRTSERAADTIPSIAIFFIILFLLFIVPRFFLPRGPGCGGCFWPMFFLGGGGRGSTFGGFGGGGGGFGGFGGGGGGFSGGGGGFGGGGASGGW